MKVVRNAVYLLIIVTVAVMGIWFEINSGDYDYLFSGRATKQEHRLNK